MPNSLDRYKRGPNKTGADTSDWNNSKQSNEELRDKLRHEDKNTWKITDISKKVDEAWKINEGFSGKLPSKE
jgi:hypothetical protein